MAKLSTEEVKRRADRAEIATDHGGDIAKRPVGRPALYHPSYCETVIEMGKAGKSPAQMCGYFSISRQTIDDWAERHSEFAEAMKRARMHAYEWWENAGQAGLFAEKFNALVWKVSMQARFREDYTERQEIMTKQHVTVEVETAVQALTEEQRQQLRGIVLALQAPTIDGTKSGD